MTAADWIEEEFGNKAKLTSQVDGPIKGSTISFYIMRNEDRVGSLIAYDYGNGDGFQVHMPVTGYNNLRATAIGIYETLERNTEQSQTKG